MSTKRNHKRPRVPDGDRFTLVHELMASPVDPMPADEAAGRVRVAQHYLDELLTAPAPSVLAWRCCAMVGNVMEVLLELDIVQDPDVLLAEAFQALREAATRNVSTGAPIRLTGPGIVAVRTLFREYGEILAQLPHRTVINAYRQTERRLYAVDAGIKRAGDYVAQIDGRAP